MFHSGNHIQLLQQVSEHMEFWFLMLKFSKKNFMTCQVEIDSYVQFDKDSLPAGS